MELWIGAIASLIAVVLGTFLFMRPDRSARRFALFAFAAGTYVLSLAALFFSERFVFSHVVIITGALVIATGYVFALTFRRQARPRDYLGLIPIACVALLAPTGIFIEGMARTSVGLAPVHGPCAPLLAVVVLGYCFVIAQLLIKAYRRSQGVARAQARQVIVAFSCLFASIFICNVLGPLVGFSATNMVTGLSLIVFLGCMTYSLTVQRLFDVNLLLYSVFTAALAPLSVLLGIGFATGLLAIVDRGAALEPWLLATAGGAIIGSIFADLVRPRSTAYLRRVFSPDRLTREQRAALAGERRLVADVAHGLQTPLAVLRAEVEGSDGLASDLHHRLVRAIDDLSVRMRRLITYSRAGMPLDEAAGVVRLDELVNEQAEYVAVVASERGVTLRTETAASPVIGRAEDLGTLITNLLSNALEYASRGGGLHEVFISCARRHEEVVLTITDTGPGMSAEERQRACEPLYRASGARAGQGMGLGLAIVQQVAVAHGGSLALQVRAGGGTVATVRLPVATPELLH